MYEVKIIADSYSFVNNKSIVTMQLTYPRYIHAELMTHRVFSRNASSSRAIPVKKLIDSSLENMVMPIRWGLNQAGMQATDDNMNKVDADFCEMIWKDMADYCAKGVAKLAERGLHKQWANRPLEWFGNITVVVTATEWDNFFELRRHTDAQPEIRHLADLMYEALVNSKPELLKQGEWHLPYVLEEELDLPIETLLKVSTARCARVSYLTQDGTVPSVEKDVTLYERLVGSVPLHASPCEHQATPLGANDDNYMQGNFIGWVQHRKLLEQEFLK